MTFHDLRGNIPADEAEGLTGECYQFFGDECDGVVVVTWVEKHRDGHGVVVGVETLSPDEVARRVVDGQVVYRRPQ